MSQSQVQLAQQLEQKEEGRLSICWATDFEGIGNAYGYTTHNKNMRKHTSMIADITNDSPVAVHIQTADRFKPIEGKKNYLFTMFEGERVPASYMRGINECDHIIVPCTQNERLFRQYTDKPISVCKEGVDTNIYTYKQRSFSIPFRFLWVGAPNPRKGWEEMMCAWKFGGCDRIRDIELYVKTTLGELNERKANVIFDSRNYSLQQLVELYHSAHCFLFPTRAEGFGLTLAEAMCTGLPCIATRYSGPEDFFDSYVGYPIRYKMHHFYLEPYELHTEMATPDVNDLISLMGHVLNNYSEALRKGRKAAERIRHYFTWPLAAQRLVEIIRESS